MSKLTVHLEYYNEGRGHIDVELDDGGEVSLRINAEEDTEPWIDRTLSPSEARALAAALVHYASEAERG